MNGSEQRYPFCWELFGEIEAGRPKLGCFAPVDVCEIDCGCTGDCTCRFRAEACE